MLIKEILASSTNEVFDPKTAFEIQWDDFDTDEIYADASDNQGRTIAIKFIAKNPDFDAVTLEFSRGDNYAVTGEGDASAVFSTVLRALETYLADYRRPEFMLFSAKEASRQKLYQTMITRFASKFGYTPSSVDQLPEPLQDQPPGTFVLTNQN